MQKESAEGASAAGEATVEDEDQDVEDVEIIDEEEAAAKS
jgi:hypothetical protein